MSAGFLSELKRRNVFRMAGLYLVGAWLLVQVAGTVLPMFGAPGWVPRSIVILLAIGFLPALAFAWIFELTPDGLKREAEVPPEHSIVGQTARRMEYMMAALLVLSLGYFAFDKLVLTPKHDAALVAAAAHAAMQARGERQLDKSIAVLPLVNAGEQSQQFFSDGLSESLIIALSQFSELKVIGRNSAFQFRNSKDDSAAIGRKLGVAHLLEGSVQHAGDAVRISLELIDATDGRTLWSQRYDRPYADLFKLQDEITSTVAAVLKTKLLPSSGTTRQTDRPVSGNLAAYDAYLRGKQSMYNGEGWNKVIEYQGEATRLDPGYAAAWAQLAVAWASIGNNSAQDPATANQAFAKAHDAIETALRLSPDLGIAHGAQGYLLLVERRDWKGALAEFQRAVALSPNDFQIQGGYSLVLSAMGRLQAAIEGRRLTVKNEPLVSGGYSYLVPLLIGEGRLGEAEKNLSIVRNLEQSPYPLSALMDIAILRGDARKALQIAEQQPAQSRELHLAIAMQLGSDRTAMDAALARVLANDTVTKASPYQIARIYALRSDLDQTLAWLERAWTAHDPHIQNLLYDPLILRFRQDPRLIAFCTRIGLPPPSASEALSIDEIRVKLTERR